MSKTKTWTAETIAVGSELLLGGRLDTNSLFIADRLAACGIELRYKTTVGDDLSDIVAVLKTALRRARVVILTGGLGPTIDDLTREAVAQATGHRLSRRKAALDGMIARLVEWGRTPTTTQFRQAMIPARAAISHSASVGNRKPRTSVLKGQLAGRPLSAPCAPGSR